MRKVVLMIGVMLLAVVAGAQEFNKVPRAWKWVSDREVVFTYDGTYQDSTAFKVDARNGRRTEGVKAPEKYSDFPVRPEGAVNLTYSPDSTRLAFTRDNDLYVVDIASGEETRLTHDGSDLILNGYASWVYYEEIFGRPSRYRAFWWSPDSKKIGFYRFDNSHVPLFPIYSAFADSTAAATRYSSPKVTDLALGGSLSETRYPKAGQTNPQVRIGIIDLDLPSQTVWADFDPAEDQYFGIPFWSPDSKEFFIARMPRLQNTLDLYSVNAADGSKTHIYNETYKTWLNWINPVIFTEKGLYMAREFETGWQQIYFLSYDGKEFRRLTDGTNWSVNLLRVDEKKGDVYFTAKRDATVRQALYKVDAKGVVTALTDPAYHVTGVRFSPDGKYFAASYSNVTTPARIAIFPTTGGMVSEGHCGDIAAANLRGPQPAPKKGHGLEGLVVADMKGPDYDASKYSLGSLVHMTTPDGFTLPGMIVYPYDFDPSKKYPVHVDIYGGPDTPLVRDRWVTPNENNQWYSANGIIQITVDPRAGGHNGRESLDMIYRRLTVHEVKDFCSWADWLMELPYVQDDKIGVEGFSFGGTMTSMLLMQAPDKFHYGIAGGGVYDWALYDSHYTERYMDTPQNNPEGYAVSKVLNYVEGYPASFETAVPVSSPEDARTTTVSNAQATAPVMLKLTHGTGDDNVHHQNTLQLLDALHKAGKNFDFMIYPDGMHGYYGYQGDHFLKANRAFWLKHLKMR
ncbi:MAG: DPP IV N-terminal domain-containing protein [Bacteroidales bacterium]|nr:DPP IV N-terminal domain-containing protein [Bacteroidales bacterium]